MRSEFVASHENANFAKNSYFQFDGSQSSGVQFNFPELGNLFIGCAINNFEFCERTVIDIWQFH